MKTLVTADYIGGPNAIVDICEDKSMPDIVCLVDNNIYSNQAGSTFLISARDLIIMAKKVEEEIKKHTY